MVQEFTKQAPIIDGHGKLKSHVHFVSNLDWLIAHITKLVPPREGMRVLDVGAGTAILSRKLAQTLPRCEVTALDLTPAMLEHARARAAEEGLRNIRFEQVCPRGIWHTRHPSVSGRCYEDSLREWLI